MALLLLLLLLLALPTQALDAKGQGLFLIFRNGAVRTDETAYTKPGYVSAPDVMVEWVIQDGDKVASNYLRNGNSVAYSPPVVSEPVLDRVIEAAEDKNLSDNEFLKALRASYVRK